MIKVTLEQFWSNYSVREYKVTRYLRSVKYLKDKQVIKEIKIRFYKILHKEVIGSYLYTNRPTCCTCLRQQVTQVDNPT